jgi:hypothetical protein
MNKLYRAVFYLFIPYMLWGVYHSYETYGTKWHVGADWLPETIVNANAPYDTFTAIGVAFEKPAFIAAIIILPSLFGLFLYECRKLQKMLIQRDLFGAFMRNQERIDRMPEHLRDELDRRNLAEFKKRGGRVTW